MAQRTEKEETEFKVPDPLTLCVNDCSNTTNTICQNCFNASTTAPSSSPPSAAAFLKFSAGEKAPRSGASSRRSDGSRTVKPLPVRTEPDSTLASSRKEINRCSGCRRKVGLTGFRCRCGDMFCAEHRYSDRHVCSYDYKTAGRNAIARENPVVKAAKILKV